MKNRPGFAALVDTAVPPSVSAAPTDPERARIAAGTADQPGRWWAFGPYLSERAWGTVREDYSADGRAWEYLPHDHARSRHEYFHGEIGEGLGASHQTGWTALVAERGRRVHRGRELP